MVALVSKYRIFLPTNMKKLINIIAFGGLLIGQLSVPATAETEILDYIVAIVNDDVIVNTALQQELEPILKQWHQRTGSVPPRQDLEKQVLEKLILIKLQLQQAEKTGIRVEDSQLNNKLRQIAAQNKMDLQTFRNYVEKQGLRYELVREKLRQQEIIKRLRKREVVSKITVNKREIDNFLANQKQQGTLANEYHLRHILIALPEAPSPENIEAMRRKAQQVVTQLRQGGNFQALAAELSDQSESAVEGGDLGWLKAGEIRPLLLEWVNKMTVGDISDPIRDIVGFHIIKLVDKRGGKSIVTQTRVRHILIKLNKLVSEKEAQYRLTELRERQIQGEDFALLAQAHSEDQTTAADGGMLGWLNPGDTVLEFEQVMNRLSENQISQPFESRYGWHIMQVLERRQHDNTEQALRTQAAKQIHQRKIQEELDIWLRQLRDEAYIESKRETASW